jgi:DNA-binding GntR family transcriptional regulator
MTAETSLTDRAVETLRQDILACRLFPGATLSEGGLAERLSLGKSPVRAALARLADEGLVVALPRRGWVVSTVTIRDIHEVFALRLLLEPEAARRAAGHADAAALARLDAVCQLGYQPEDTESAVDFLGANRAFHVAVAELSGNARLARQIGRLLDESTRMLVLGLGRRDRTSEMAHEHRALIEALAAGDADSAARIATQQIAASRDMVFTALTGVGSPVSVI